jgi:rare lipoprotein A
MVEVRRSDGRRVVVRINDRGPYGSNGSIIDLSRRAAEELGIGERTLYRKIKAYQLE